MYSLVALISILFLAFWLLVQLFYYLFFFTRLAVHKNKNEEENTTEPFTIIVCAKNEETNIIKNLPAWLTQIYNDAKGNPNYEVLLIDDNSDDGTHYALSEFEKQYQHLRVVYLRQEAKGIKGKKFPLSMGIKEAKYAKLLLTDADCVPASQYWLQKMANKYNANTAIVLGYGAFEAHATFLNKWQRWETTQTAIQYFSYAKAGLAYMGVGRNLSYAKDLFMKNKGFSSHHHLLSGDDDLFINQVTTASNVNICVDKNAFTYSQAKPNYASWWFQKSRHFSTGRYYKPLHQFLLGLFSFSHFMFWVGVVCSFVFYKYWYIGVCIVALRWLVIYICTQACLLKLQENDLVNYIIPFDILTLFYNLRMLPNLFKKQKEWK